MSNITGIRAHSLRHTSATLGGDADEPLYHPRDRLVYSNVLVVEYLGA